MSTLFYSWQSDLPSNKNRNFIEDCIGTVMKRCKKLQIDVIKDRDTKNVPGTPDICDTLFSKIDKCSFFVADISILNNNISGKKTPNPNVLLELGYAVNILGWERVICIFNSEFGDISDLPFDLRQRRHLVYSSIDWNTNVDSKSKEKDKIVSSILDTIKEAENGNVLLEGSVTSGLIYLANKLDKFNEIIVYYQIDGKNSQCNFKSINYPNKFDINMPIKYGDNNISIDIIDTDKINLYVNNNNVLNRITKIIGRKAN